MTVRFVVAILAILVPLVPGIVVLYHLDRKREWEHLERMKALELGLPLPESPGWPTHVWIALVYIAIGAAHAGRRPVHRLARSHDGGCVG